MNKILHTMPINFHTKVRPQKDEFILFFKDFQITKMSYLSCKIILHDINIYKGLYIEVKFDSNPNSLNYRIISLTLILFTKTGQTKGPILLSVFPISMAIPLFTQAGNEKYS